ncbi:MAG: hypothetical protein AABX04_02780 [Nanoarchaeota archaeon]
MDKYPELKAKFFKAFANVPVPLREEIIASLDKDTFSWYTANAEIEHDTEKAKKLLNLLYKMGAI